MSYVFVSVSSGLISEVRFFATEPKALEQLRQFSRTANMEKDDAAVFGPKGLIANVEEYLDDPDRPSEAEKEEESPEQEMPIYLIANPHSRLGFLVVSPDDPLGFNDPCEALSELGQMRKQMGGHLTLYWVQEVEEALVEKADLETYHDSIMVEDFDYDLVKEHLM